jgi:hypothetical protein
LASFCGYFSPVGLYIYIFFGGLPIGEKSPQKEAKSEEIKKN